MRKGFSWLNGGGKTGAIIRSKDWSQTPVGPIESWPQTLTTALSICLLSKQPMFVWWKTGVDNLTIFYNDAYIPIAAGKHPDQIGADPRSPKGWAEMWPYLKPLVDSVFLKGTATWNENLFLPIYRKEDLLEEAYWSFSYSPIITGESEVSGMYCSTIETTKQVLVERRLKLLRNLGAGNALSNDADVAAHAAKQLADYPQDLPFTLLYLVDPDGKQGVLAAKTGLASGGIASPANVRLDSFERKSAWPLAEVHASRSMMCVGGLRAKFKDALPKAPWDESPDEAVILPLGSPNQNHPTGFLVAGLSPRLRFDSEYESFLNLVTGQLATNFSNARMVEAERRRAKELAELDRAKTAFFSNVSHEFRTPLTLMLGTLEETLAAPDVLESHRGELLIAHRNSLRLLRMVNTLLDFSRVEAGRIEASYEAVDLASLTADLASNFRSACERAGLFLKVECQALAAPVFVDRDMWEKIVLNLLSNAFKYTLQGGIAVRLSAAGGHARLEVRDTGTGIPKEELPRMFERFHRIAGARGRTHEGTGIGLALVQELVKLHGGTVEVESNPGKGSTFAVSVPLGSAHLPADRIGAERTLETTSLRAQAFVDEALRWLPGAAESHDHVRIERDAIDQVPAGGAARSASRRRVLVVDDNADMRDYVARLLRPFHDVDTAPDGLEALGSVIARRPDLVLCDVMMPGLDGFGLLRAVRADPGLRDIPVIMLSARAGEEAQVEGMEAGADDYLVKPFSARELLARVESSLKLAKLRNERTAELQASEERFRALVNASSDVVYRMGPDWREMRHLVGRDFIADTLDPSRTWLEKYIHPDDQQRVMEVIDEAIRTRSVFELEHRVRRVDGTLGWTFSRAIPLLDAKGEITEWFGMASDVTGRKVAEEHQRLLVNELNHRVKNTLASVHSIAMQTMRSAGTTADFQDAFVSRLLALSRAHELLTRSGWQAASFMDIVRQTLEPYGAGDRIEIGGPDVQLSPSAAMALNMMLHELATNAAKYGALSVPPGKIAVQWALDDRPAGPALAIRWSEQGGPAVAPPRRRGFGSRLIERGVAQELDGEVSLDFDSAGVQCRIRLPLSDRIAVQWA